MSAYRHQTLPGDGNLPPKYLESSRAKVWPIAAILLSCAINVVVFYLDIHNWQNTSLLREVLINKHAFIAPVVQVLANILAALQLYVVFSIFEFFTRTLITQKYATLNKLRFWVAAYSRRLNFNLQVKEILLLLVIVIVSGGVAPLWAASLSPQLSTTWIGNNMIFVPMLGNDGFADNVNGNYLNHCLLFSNNQSGTFSSCPAKQFLSGILLAAGKASTPGSSASRFDATQNIYIGRSYGIGAAVGLTDSNLTDCDDTGRDYVNGYNYTEAGFETAVSCTYTNDSIWEIHLIQAGKVSEGVPYIYEAADTGQNGFGFYSTWGLGDDSEIVSWTTNRAVNSTEPVGAIYIAAGESYSLLSNISCSVSFMPKTFRVSVNKIQKTITVTPGSDFTDALDPDFHLRNIALEQLGIVSQVSTTLYFSAIGDALMTNMANSASLDSATSNLTTVAESFMIMLDAVLLALTSAQTQLQGYPGKQLSQQVSVQLEVTSVRIGSHDFIIALSVLNGSIVVVFAMFIFWTRFWKDLPQFNYLDVGSVIVASALDGRGIRRDMRNSIKTDGLRGYWTGTQDDQRIGRIAVGVRRRMTQDNSSILTIDSSLNATNANDPSYRPTESYELLIKGAAGDSEY